MAVYAKCDNPSCFHQLVRRRVLKHVLHIVPDHYTYAPSCVLALSSSKLQFLHLVVPSLEVL